MNRPQESHGSHDSASVTAFRDNRLTYKASLLSLDHTGNPWVWSRFSSVHRTGARLNLDSAIEFRVLCTSGGRRGPYGRNGQGNQSSFGWSPPCPQGPRRPEDST